MTNAANQHSASAGSRLERVQSAIADACDRAGRKVQSVTLVAISKTIPVAGIEPLIAAGQRVFGENRVQESKAKWPELKARHHNLELHLVGPLQSNKARDAVALFDMIHSLDRPSLCRALARECDKQGRRPRLMVQVNTGAEPQKAGIPPDHASDFLKTCRETYNLEIVGLMCIPPAAQPPQPHFAKLAKLAADHRLQYLSMGMSADFVSAIEHGATHVRVGTALFGARNSADVQPRTQ